MSHPIPDVIKKPLRAYTVHDGDDGWTTVFATSNVAARRMGANELSCDFRDVDSCRRSPEFDQYAPGPVPSHALIAGNWHFECARCNEWVDEYTEERTYRGQFVYCSRTCLARDEADERHRASYEAAAIELLEANYPSAKLEYFEPVNRYLLVPMKLFFTFPGCRYSAHWVSGESTVSLHPDDVDTFVSLYRKSK